MFRFVVEGADQVVAHPDGDGASDVFSHAGIVCSERPGGLPVAVHLVSDDAARVEPVTAEAAHDVTVAPPTGDPGPVAATDAGGSLGLLAVGTPAPLVVGGDPMFALLWPRTVRHGRTT